MPWDPAFDGEGDQRIIAAVQYILWDGLEFSKNLLSHGTIREDLVGSFYSREHRISLRRGHFWKEGVEKSGEEGSGLREECRKVAGKAGRV